MKKVVLLVLMAVWLLGACAGLDGARGDSVTNRAALCAMCGASVSGDYAAYSTFKSIGPGNY